MLTFDRADFEKNISLSIKKKVKIESKWNEVKLGDLTHLMKRGKSPKYGKSNLQIIKSGQARGFYTFDFKERYFASESYLIDERKLQKGDLLLNSSGVGTAGRVTAFYLEGDFVADSHITILRFNQKIISPKYALNIFGMIGFKNIEKLALGQSGQIEMTLDTISNIKIPLPPLEIQQKIVDEIEVLEQQKETAVEKIEELKNDIQNCYANNKGTKKRLDEVCELKAGKFVKAGDIENISKPNSFPCYGGNGLRGYTKTYTNEGLFSLVGRQGALCGNVHLVNGKFHATEHALVAYPKENVNTFWLHYKLVYMNLNQYATGTAQPGLSVMNLNPIEILLPSLNEQEKIASDIKKLEKQIMEFEKQIAEIPKQKEAILKKHLE
ncbi:restriction endonuclease subunit S [Winogradskyella sp. PC D3.3]